MKYLILIALFSTNAMALDPENTYFESKGKTIMPSAAIMAAMNGESVFKCQRVEAKVSKSGTSIGLKNVKKAKLAE